MGLANGSITHCDVAEKETVESRLLLMAMSDAETERRVSHRLALGSGIVFRRDVAKPTKYSTESRWMKVQNNVLQLIGCVGTLHTKPQLHQRYAGQISPGQAVG